MYISHDSLDGKVSVIDTATDTTLTPIAVKREGETATKRSKGMALSGSILYLVNHADSTVTMIHTGTHARLPLESNIDSGGNSPENLAVSPDGEKLYIVHSYPGSIEILGY